ncbi:probable transcriptional regulator SLK2 isoform X2 [Phalaenopsis equestris]|nr:probable transcriptional regulator SLK2 isoform X2 [Phalaenopsis equestris]
MNHGNSSGPSMGASSQVTDANSSFSGGPQLPSSSSINDESYMHLPASPMSSSNNISGSSVMDGSSLVQLSPQNEQIQKQSALSPTYQSMVQEAGMLPAHKKPRLDMRVGDVSQQQVMQQLLQRHQNLQLHAIVQPQRLAQLQQQQQMMQSLPQLQRIQMQQRPQMPMGSPLQLISPVRPPLESGLCARRLMQYMFHQSHRPADNSIMYWRKFVAEYFAPRAKKRWCFSLYNNSGNHAFGAFPQAAMDAWQCGICGSKSGKGFEATYDVLPRLDQIKFDHGVLDELLYVDAPHESKLRSGMMVLEYAKAVQESVHEQCRVVREGQLRIIFTPDLKILCWEFCARSHEELLPRRIIVNQVNQLLHAAHKYQTAVTEKGSSTVSAQDLQASCNMFVSAGRQLARNVELQLLNDLGFPKRYVRCLQISEVVNCMKELIDFSQSHKMGPIDSLKNYTQQAAAKLQAQKMKVEQTDSSQNLLADPNMLNKFMAMHPGLSRLPGNSLSSASFPNNSSSPAAIGPTTNNYQHLLRNSDHSSFSGLNHNQTQPVPFQTNGPLISAGRSFQYSSAKSHQQQQDLHGKPPPACNFEPPSQATQNPQHHLPEMMNKGALPPVKGLVKPEVSAPVQNESGGDMKRSMAACNNDASKPAAMNNSFCASSNNCNIKQEAFDNLNIGDFDQDMLGELLDGIDW